ncbi:MAG: hypothetical protein NTW66_02800 [Candidatus Magasanikbacteria bacterium]|nr:hypothetical protein [Candidatus Magasanikbacteria bacterium]
MGLFIARVWFIYDENTFRKPCGFVRGNGFISQPFFSKQIGKVAIAMVGNMFNLSIEEMKFLRSALVMSGLQEAENALDRVVTRVRVVSSITEKISSVILKTTKQTLSDDAVAAMFKPLNVYFDCVDILDASNTPTTKYRFIH